MQSRELALLSGLRGGVVLLSAAAITLTVLGWVQPLFVLRDEAHHSLLEQTLFTTHVYTPEAEQRIAVSQYYACRSLVNAFRAAQFVSICAFVFVVLGLVISAFQSPTLITMSRHRERSLYAMPIASLMMLASACSTVALVTLTVVYHRHWCGNSGHHPCSADHSASSDASSDTCDPFDRCVTSLKAMGFAKREGYVFLCTALACGAVALLCELALWSMALRESEPAATLLQQPTPDEEDGAADMIGNGGASGEAAETQPLL